MKKNIKKLFLMIVVIGFFVVGKNVYAFDNDQSVSIQGFNYNGTRYSWSSVTQPFEGTGWSAIQPHERYWGFYNPRINQVSGNEYSYIRTIQGSLYSNYEPNKNYTMEIVTIHGHNFYSGQYGQGKIYNPTCNLYVSQGAVRNVSCTIEQATYINGSGDEYDRIRIYFTTSSNTYSQVLYTFQIGELNTTDYTYINVGLTGHDSNWFGYDNIYLGYDNEDTSNVGGKIDRVGGQLQENNSILGQIREKLYQFKDNFDSKMDTLISNVQSILQNMGQGISGLVQDIKNGVNGILQFISNNILGLDDIDDTLQDFVDSFEGNEVMGDIHDFLILPIDYLNYIRNTNSYCTDISFTIFNKEIIIPSGCFFWERQDVGQFRTLWNTLFGGAIIFSLGFKYFKVLHNAFDPTKDDLGGMEV